MVIAPSMVAVKSYHEGATVPLFTPSEAASGLSQVDPGPPASTVMVRVYVLFDSFDSAINPSGSTSKRNSWVPAVKVVRLVV